MNEVVTLISNVGYPIASSLILMWYIYKQSEKHDKETQGFQAVLEANTAAINRLADELHKED